MTAGQPPARPELPAAGTSPGGDPGTFAWMELEATIARAGGVPVVALSGLLDLSTVPELRDVLVRVTTDHPGATIAVDLDGLEMLDDVGLGVLLGAAARARQAGGDLVVVTNRLRERFSATGFDRAVRVLSGLAEVLA